MCVLYAHRTRAVVSGESAATAAINCNGANTAFLCSQPATKPLALGLPEQAPTSGEFRRVVNQIRHTLEASQADPAAILECRHSRLVLQRIRLL